MKRTWLVYSLLVVLILVGWRFLRSDDAGEPETARENPSLILDRVWVDSSPERYTDYMHAMLFVSDIPLGLVQKGSAYHVELELFEFKRAGKKVQVHFPQSETNRQFSYKIAQCNELPPFDLCLDLSRNPWKQGPKRYYGLSDQEAEADILGDTARSLRQAAARAPR